MEPGPVSADGQQSASSQFTASSSPVLKRKILFERTQEGRVEGSQVTSSYRNTKITTNCWTPLTKHWNLPKETPYIQRQKKKPQQDGRRDTIMIKLNLVHTGCMGYTWKIIIPIIPQKFSQRRESSEPPCQAPQPGGVATGGVAPKESALQASEVWSQEFHRTGGKRNCTLEGCTQGLTYTKTQEQKQ